jgi:hypothetical protein
MYHIRATTTLPNKSTSESVLPDLGTRKPWSGGEQDAKDTLKHIREQAPSDTTFAASNGEPPSALPFYDMSHLVEKPRDPPQEE